MKEILSNFPKRLKKKYEKQQGHETMKRKARELEIWVENKIKINFLFWKTRTSNNFKTKP